ncbi:O-antigen ligase family protein [Segetibacter aerophilus]|uniref:O-antigen ligase family protein n=1 Tax=Segetibacter aerophilus TaxID=670293 RepID=UPI0011BE6EC6|nr:O-antigen ligase family protein [Segetibacter aerophilus]
MINIDNKLPQHIDPLAESSLIYSTSLQEVKQQTFLSKVLLLLVCFGYPIQAFIIIISGSNSNNLNIGFRIIYVLISVFIIFSSFKRGIKISKPVLAFLCFWIIYTARLFYDLSIREIRFLDKPPFYVYSFALGNCLLPALAIYLSKAAWNTKNLSIGLYYILLLSNICIIINYLFLTPASLTDLLVTRVGWGEEQIINPITISLSGALLSIAAFSLIYYTGLKLKLWFRVLVISSIFIGFLNLVLGASRGPLIAFIFICLIVILFYWKSRKLVGKTFIFLLFLSSFIWVSGIALNRHNTGDIYLIERLKTQKDKTEKEDREYEWASAWEQFSKSPFLGDSFVNDYDKSYAHNLILDSLRATGVIGTFFLLYLIFLTIKKVFHILSNLSEYKDSAAICLIFLCTFIVDMVSGGIFVAIYFWSLSAFICTIPIYKEIKSSPSLF